MPVAKTTDAQPLSVEARSVRLPALAGDPALIAPVIERRTLSRAGNELLIEVKAAAVNPGETGLLALAWWNGNRSILGDADLSGVLVGLNLQSTAEQIYRALLESIVFGTRRIIDNFEEHGLEIFPRNVGDLSGCLSLVRCRRTRPARSSASTRGHLQPSAGCGDGCDVALDAGMDTA